MTHAELSTDADGNTTVVLALDGATGGHPAHIHKGTCQELEPNPEYPLNDVDLTLEHFAPQPERARAGRSDPHLLP